MKPMNLFRMHGIAVIWCVNNFGGHIYTKRAFSQARAILSISGWRPCSNVLDFWEKSGILSWFLSYFLNLYELLIYQKKVVLEFRHFSHMVWLPNFSNDWKNLNNAIIFQCDRFFINLMSSSIISYWFCCRSHRTFWGIWFENRAWWTSHWRSTASIHENQITIKNTQISLT